MTTPRIRAGFSLVEGIVATIITALLVGAAMSVFSWLRRGNVESRARSVCSETMRLVHEHMRRDAFAVSGWELAPGPAVNFVGAVDSQGKGIPQLRYEFDGTRRRISRIERGTERTFVFMEGTTGYPTFQFHLTFTDERGRTGLPPEKARNLTVELVVSDKNLGSQNFTFFVSRKSRFSSDVSSQELTWD